MELEYESKRPLYIPYAGPILLEFPLLNKGSAFTEEERSHFNLHGLLPEAVETIEEQVERAYRQYQDFKNDNDKHIYLRNIQDTNETLFYRLLDSHLSEMMPIIYTPTVGEACEHFSDIYRRARGLFISYPNRDRIDDMLQNATKQNVKVIVVTDGERILGLGDQGIGGMGIPIGKLSLYTACGGISPAYTLPVVLDVGTNNPQRLNDPLYMGWRHPRISGEEYHAFVEEFIQAVKRRWPNVLLQFEDFAQNNATPLLNRYRDEICCFNDDIQGTAAVTLGSLIAASRAAGSQLRDQTVTFLGAGSAGCGIAEQIIAQMKSEGLSEDEARARVFMVDRFGLLTDKLPVFATARDDDIGVLFGRFDKLQEHRAHGLLVLRHHRIHRAAALVDVALHAAHQADIQWRVDKDREVHFLAQADIRQQQDPFQNNDFFRFQVDSFFLARVFGVAVQRQLDRLTGLQHLQMLEQQVVIHGARVVVVGFDPFFHGQVSLVFIVTVFWNNADVLIADLLAEFAVQRAGDKAFSGGRCASYTNNDALMRIVSHKIKDLIS